MYARKCMYQLTGKSEWRGDNATPLAQLLTAYSARREKKYSVLNSLGMVAVSAHFCTSRTTLVPLAAQIITLMPRVHMHNSCSACTCIILAPRAHA